MPSRNVLLGPFGRPCGVRPVSRYWSLSPWPVSARDQRRADRDQRRSGRSRPARRSPRGRGAAVPRPAATGCALDPRLALRARWRHGLRTGVALAGRRSRRGPSPRRAGSNDRSGATSPIARLARASSSPSASGKWHAARCSGPSQLGRAPGRRAAALLRLAGSAGGSGSPTAASIGRGQVAAQHDPLAPVGDVRVRHRHGREQRAGVRVARRARTASLGVGDLDDLAEVHHRDPVADVPHHRQVVGDEQVGQAAAPPADRRAG